MDSHMDMFLGEYSDAVAKAGGLPVLLTHNADPRELVRRLDALIIAGGNDVDPRLYGEVPGPESTRLDPQRDRFELALVEAALEAQLPTLGICRGAQLINVAAGGTLIGDLPPGEGEAHGVLDYPLGMRVHTVTFEPGTLAHGIYGDEAFVNSFHHQAVRDLGRDVRASGFAPDGIVEAIEIDGHPVLGLQWHPEFLDDPGPVFEWLFGAARREPGDLSGRIVTGAL
jgi:putative glutamine amidotransferase